MNPARELPQTAPVQPRSRLGGLNPLRTVSIAWRAILANPLRSALTTLGIIIGVASVIALTAIGTGSTANITKSLQSLGTNLLTVSSETNTRGGPGGLVRQGGPQNITLKDAEAIRALGTEVVGIAPTLQRNAQVKYEANNTSAAIVGTWPDYASVRNAQPEFGSFFTEADNAGRKRVAVIGYQVAQDLFGSSQAALGQRMRIAGVSFTVVGVLPDKGNSGFATPNYNVLIPLSTYIQRLGRADSSGVVKVSAVFVQAADKSQLDDLKNRITDLLATRHKKTDPNDYDFSVQNQADALASVNQVTQTLTLFLGGIAAISLLVGGIGIMNIMLVSVTERTKEIGIRKALGAKPRDILMQFLVEAFVLSVGGGILGILAGFGLAYLAGPALKITPVITGGPILLAFVFAAAVGIFFGLYPALRASRLDPVESLRYE
ncbi:ABC transporter permease [Meiothermus granaticius]|uniref:Macrolide export ATP-binding/permease protein MacB n=1 Tax=Meiothermus granaticius NBRC 107808 TaxID=1227551 RepID=A0A399FCK7_9DEIN|nr:ABC transporter permease [Meiothermus granaticius]MCL6527848.1 ABC transporter permease [Thermaceae bacterium]RIH92421.1 Macrolide export ATP-binding/permease protein MacB [Meiothermus granaticius NBRC 107808]GEM87456.1 ABC transporter permease [Meiothermus granaticius NBRC 107808]